MIKLFPNVTEKSTMVAKAGNVYSFVVMGRVNDIDSKQIAAEVAKRYSVQVVAINVLNRQGKIKRIGAKRHSYNRQSVKIAYVKLAEGQTIADFKIEEQSKK